MSHSFSFNSGKQRQTNHLSFQLPPKSKYETENIWTYQYMYCLGECVLTSFFCLINNNGERPSYSVYFVTLMTRWGIESILSSFSKADLVLEKTARTSTWRFTVLFLSQKCLTHIFCLCLACVGKTTQAEGSGVDVGKQLHVPGPVFNLLFPWKSCLRFAFLPQPVACSLYGNRWWIRSS